jgi:fructose-specific phosphotransferase system IIC component
MIVVISMCTYNSVGVTIAKYMNSLTRAVCDVSRAVIIWVVGIIVTATMGADNKAFRW